MGKNLLTLFCSAWAYTIVEVLLEEGAGVNAQDKGGITPLHYAANHGHIKIVKLLLKNEANVNLQDKNGTTPLHSATNHGYIKIVKLLLKNEANVNAQNEGGITPLHYAANCGHIKMVKLLQNYGTNPSFIHRPKDIIAGVTVGILAAIVTPLALIYATVLPALAIVGITVASALIVGGISYGVAYKSSEHSLNSKLSEISCSNVDGNKQTV